MKRKYIKEIVKILRQIDSVWLLEQVYRCVVNVTRE